MKNCIRLVIGAVLICSTLITSDVKAQQVPQTLTYQSVLRNSNNVLMANTAVGIKISILQGNAQGLEIFSETQSVTTNANGLLSLQIGAGNAVTGAFSNIDWANGPYFIKTETDPTGGNNYSIVGTQQLASVPYALYAAKSGGNVFETTADDPNAIHNINSGNVGIGTDLPGEKLDVAGNVLVRQNQIVQGNSTVGQNLTVYGNLLFPGGQPNQGKVLTSDMLGYATWQTPAAPDLSGLATTTDLNNLQNQVNVQSTINQIQQNQINDLNSVNQTQDQNISTLNSQINDQNTINQAQQNQINDLNAVNQIQQNQINDLNTVNQTQDQNISALNSQVQTNTTDNIVQQIQIDNMSTQNAMQNQSISNLGTQVQTNTTDITNLQSQISNVQSNFVITQDDPSSIYNINSGNVGIGTDLPMEKLDVSGNVRVRQNTTVEGNNTTIGNSSVGQDLLVNGNSTLNQDLEVMGKSTLRQDLDVLGNSFTLFNNLTLRNSIVGGNLEVNRTAYLHSLIISDSLTIPSGNPAQGKVLTSDNNGVATWQAPAAPDLSGYATTQALDAEMIRAMDAELNIATTLADETTRATVAENNLETGLNAETSRATAAEYNLQSSLNAETTRATVAEQALDNKIYFKDAPLSGSIYSSNPGNVGIGTDYPTEKLDVLGNLKVQGTTTAFTFVKAGGTSSEFLMADGSTSAGPDLSGLATTTDLNNLQNQVNVQSTINQVQQSQITDLNSVNQTQDQSISNLGTQVQLNTADNINQQNQIDNMNTQNAMQDQSIMNLGSQVQMNTADNLTQQTQIDNMNLTNVMQDQSISYLGTQVQLNTADNLTQQTQIDNMNLTNVMQDQSIMNLGSQVQMNTADNINQQNQIDNMNTQNAMQDQSIMNLGSQVQMNTADNLTQQTQIDNMSTQNAMQDQSISNLGTQVQLNTADNLTQQTQIDNMSTQNAMQDQSIMNLDLQVLTNTTDINNLQSQISNVQSNFVTTSSDPNNISNINSGNVGIGTNMPNERLDVSGNVLVRQNLNVDGNSMTIGNSYVGGTSRANGFVKVGGQSYEYLMADGTTSYGPSLSGLVTMADLSGYATTQDLNVETNRAIATESFIQTNLDAETNRATASESNIQTSLDAEISRAIAAEQALDNKIYFKDAILPGSIYSSNPGNVGIGTDLPNEKLDVNGNLKVRDDLMVEGDNMTIGNSYVGGTSRANGFVKVGGQSYEYLMADGSVSTGGTGGASVFVATTSNPDNISNVNAGNVGIGTDLPSEKLDVNGNLKVRQNATITGTLNIEPAPWDITSTSFPSPAQINLSGRMGIGTNNPSALLNIVGGDRQDGLRVESNNASVALVSTREYQIFTRQQGDLAFYDQTAEQETNGGYPYRMIINSTGKVGIGNQSPTEQLDVTGNIKSNQNVMANSFVKAGGQANEFLMADGSVSTGGTGGASVFVATTSNPDNISNVNAGNVGIGTDYPTEKLDVLGNLKVRGTIIAGENSTASGNSAFSLGRNTTASGDYSTAMGYNTVASGPQATAFGIESNASGLHSLATGYGTHANGTQSTTMGGATMASGVRSTAMGYLSNASGDASVAMGTSTTARSNSEVALGMNNTDYQPGSTEGYVATDRLFVIGNGTDENNKSNAMVVLKNGNTTINGTTTANSFVKSGGQSYEYLMADGTTSYGPSLSGLVTMADLSGYATTQDLNVETNRAIATESFIQTNLDAETNRATAAESNIQTSLDAETMRATDAENNIETSLIVETNRAIAAEQALASATKRGTVGYFGNVSIGTGFTSSALTIGYYSIIFDTPLTNTPIVVATLVDAIGFCAISNVSTTGFTVIIKSPNNTAMSSSFSFIVMAP